jgi:uncharacterized protein
LKDILQGIALFNYCDFFAAHNFFEDMWIVSDKSNKKFFQGLIQISVGCHHLISGNYKGSFNQFQKGTMKLKKYFPCHMKVDIRILLMELEPIVNELSKGSNLVDPQKIRNLIPTIKLTK